MKKFSFSLTFGMIMLFGFSQTPSTNPLPDFFKLIYESPEYYYGNVKEIHWKRYRGVEKDGKIIKGEPLKSIGNLGKNMWWSHYFDKSGKLNKVGLEFDENKWIGILHYENNILNKIYWLKDDTLHSTWEYIYKNNIIERFWKLADNGEIQSRMYSETDKNGYVLKQLLVTSDGESKNTSEWKRDIHGVIIHKRQIDPTGKITQNMDKWEYNDRGQLVRVHRNIFGGEEVDRYGIESTYEYDDMGNWIKKVGVIKYGNNSVITERTFVYR